MIWSAIRRAIAVLFGCFTAAFTGAIVLFTVGAYWAAQEVTSHMPPGDEVDQLFGQGLGAMAFAFTVAPVLTVVPALLVIVVGEVARIRSVLYYVVGCGAAAAVMPLAALHAPGSHVTYNAPYFSVLATAGFAAGLVYWLIAGRRA